MTKFIACCLITGSLWAISPGAYSSLQSRIESAGFSDERIRILRQSVSTTTFTADQAAGLIDLFSYSDDKIKALNLLRTRIEDPDNAHVIVERFTYDSDKRKAAAALEGIESALPKKPSWKRRKICWGDGPGRYCYTEYYER